MRKRILLADDSITIQKVVELTFSDGDYEVVAVNNGAKAIQKIAEMKPDVILSDIIMPEKNGYEVCEFVKSHPVYRGIPVILLTGTFEPFDPDRADKAGCDAVVTKPFESQSLIQKVEELIAQSQAASKASESSPAASPEPTPWAEQAPTPAPEPQQFQTARAFPSPSFASEAGAPSESEPEVYGSSPATAPPTAEMPFASSSTGGETRAFPKMSFDDMPPTSPQIEATPAIEPSPWNQSPSSAEETRAFPKTTFDEMQRASSPAELSSPGEADSPWGETPSPASDTRGFPQMSFDELQKASENTPPQAAELPDSSPWDEAPASGGEAPSFNKMSFDDLRQASSAEPPSRAGEPSPWDEPPAASTGETRAFPKMTFDDLPQASHPPAKEAESSWGSAPATSSWSPAEERGAEPAVRPSFSTPAPSALGGSADRDSFFPQPPPPPAAEPAWASRPSESSSPSAVPTSDLTEDQIDRIARRVVQLLSDQVVRNIAWEVIPDLAEMVVKERIRQLESEP